MGRDRIADPTTVFVKVGVARVMSSGLNSPVSAAELQQLCRRCQRGGTTAHDIEESLFLMAIAFEDSGTADGQELIRERKPERLGRNREHLEFTDFHTAPLFFDRSDLRGKKTPAEAGVEPCPPVPVDYP